MRIYHAGSATHLLYDAGLRRPLVSYADVTSASFRFWVDAQPSGADVFLDSGAYTVWRSGKGIDVDTYCEYLRLAAPRFTTYVALDVIGDWRASAANLDRMLAHGLRPLPVFHRGSPWPELERLARDHQQVGIGGMMSESGRKLHRQTQEFAGPFLDECFRRLRAFWPVRVHAFGLVTQWVLERYPLYSADSATVVLGASLGTYARFLRGQIRWKYWWEDVPETLDGELGELAGQGRRPAREARYRRSLDSVLRLERHVTDLWSARGVEW
jgi:hypothetical protein